MAEQTKLKFFRFLSAILLVALLSMSGVIYVSAHGGDGTLIHACVNNRNGAVRIIGASAACDASKETALDWGIQGPKGDKGDVGPMGPQGPQGEPGTGGASCDLEWRTKDALDALSVSSSGYPSNFQVSRDCFVDTDLDKLSDHDEERLGTDPLDPDTDDDGIYDGIEVFVPCRFYQNNSLIHNIFSSPISSDADRDGFTDADECFLYLSNPWSWNSSSISPYTDTDGDGLANNAEGWYGGNMLETDPDGDGFSDRVEAGAGTNPYDTSSHP